MSLTRVKARQYFDTGVVTKKKLSRLLHGAAGPAMLAVASSLLLWPFARLDFDRHHDGYMLAQAIAVHQGASVHADVFAQYGPVTPWVQSLALFLPIAPGLALRTFNVTFIALTVFFLADMGRKTPRNWPVSRAVGWWAAIAWIVLADLWIGIPMLPWSSTLAALFSVATLYLFTRSLRCAEDGRPRQASVAALSSGIVLGLMPFTRINVGLSAVAVCLVVAALKLFAGGADRRPAMVLVFGMFLSMSIVAVVLVGTNSLKDFYYQAIEWPLTFGRDSVVKWHTASSIALIFTLRAVPALLVCIAILLQLRARTTQRGWSFTTSGVRVFTVLVGVIIVGWENLPSFSRESEVTSGKSGAWTFLRYLTSPHDGYIYGFMVMSALASVLVCIFQTVKYISGDRSSRKLTAWLLLGGLSLSGLTQVVPTWDPRHVWWAAPVGLLLLFSIVRTTSKLSRLSGNLFALPLLAAAVMAVFSGSVYWNSERVPGPSGTIIEGMRVSQATSDQINQDTEFLRLQLYGSQSVIYLAADGDLSIIDGKYRSADSYFVGWGGAPQVQTRIANGNPIVVQKSFLGEGKIRELARSIRYEVIARNPRLVVLRPVANTSG
jgi:hypothetical protein